MKKTVLLVLAVVMTGFLAAAQREIYVKDSVAIGGYDAVAYFTEKKPVKGNKEFTVIWKNEKWLFANRQNAELFETSPEKYAPQYGGYCAYGCSRGYKAKTSPDAWTIADGKLYLNYNIDVKGLWSKDQQVYIQKADANWPKVKESKYPG